MPVHIDEIVADVDPAPGGGGEGAGGAGGGGDAGGGEGGPSFCEQLQRQRMAEERRERMRVD